MFSIWMNTRSQFLSPVVDDHVNNVLLLEQIIYKPVAVAVTHPVMSVNFE